MRSAKHIDIFVASPGDVAEERNILEQCILEINRTWGRELSIYFDLIRWENNTNPDFGVDAQDVINKQIPKDYDIFFGIFWSRFGTPTSRSASGTEEEFRIAYDRLKENGSPKLILYFNKSKIDPTIVDLDQLKKVQDFRKEVSSLGGYYKEYPSIESFREIIRAHLSSLLQEFRVSNEKPIENNNQLTPKSDTAQEIHLEIVDNEIDGGEYDPQFLDLLAESENDVEEGVTSMNEMNIIMESYTQKMTINVNELKNANTAKEKKKITDLIALDTKKLAQEIRNRYGKAFDFLTKSIRSLSDILPIIPAQKNKEDLASLKKLHASLQELRPVTTGLSSSLAGLKDVVTKTPYGTSSMKYACKELSATLDQQIEKGDTVIFLIDETLNLIDSVITQIISHPLLEEN